ncbi:hypothetical protein ACFQ08_01990 [Streptosporangium algeriense]|uniref:Uncharacterized protein n=1 Tax=Streptosporangium algeriense TaxID=1682748 RepID=A0ABW3DHG1_9ACTN
MSDETLAQVLRRLVPAGPPGQEVRARRQELADFVRAAESRVFTAPASVADRLRSLLGWDDQTLHDFVESPMVVHSSTHASMNAFAPMLTFPWFCLRVASLAAVPQGSRPIHLRTQVTHNNISDNRWKPHIWWRYTATGHLARTQIFSRNRRNEHQILLCQPVPGIGEGDLSEIDSEAVALAAHSTNFAYHTLLYRMAIERHLGMHDAGGTLEVPLDMLNAFSLRGDACSRWRQALDDLGLELRVIGDDLELHTASPETSVRPEATEVATTCFCPNYVNLAQAYRMGLSVTMGAEKMTGYLDEMHDVVSKFFALIGEDHVFPQFLGVSGVDLEELAPLPEGLRQEINRAGGRPSLPLYAGVFGEELLPRLDRALDHPVDQLASVVTRPWS